MFLSFILRLRRDSKLLLEMGQSGDSHGCVRRDLRWISRLRMRSCSVSLLFACWTTDPFFHPSHAVQYLSVSSNTTPILSAGLFFFMLSFPSPMAKFSRSLSLSLLLACSALNPRTCTKKPFSPASPKRLTRRMMSSHHGQTSPSAGTLYSYPFKHRFGPEILTVSVAA